MSPRVLVFDGACGFCTTWVRRLAPVVSADVAVEPYQRLDLDSLGLTAGECARALQFVDGQQVHAGAAAVAAFLRSSDRRPWRLAGRMLGSRPAQTLARPVYGWVSRHRDHLPGGRPECEGQGS